MEICIFIGKEIFKFATHFIQTLILSVTISWEKVPTHLFPMFSSLTGNMTILKIELFARRQSCGKGHPFLETKHFTCLKCCETCHSS